MIDRVKQWFASGPRDDTAEIQAEAAKIRAGWAASKPPAPVRSLVPAATLPPAGGAGVVSVSAAGSCGGGGAGGGGYAYPYWATASMPSSFATTLTTGVHYPPPIDPIYTIPPTPQWREQYTQALETARYQRVVREE